MNGGGLNGGCTHFGRMVHLEAVDKYLMRQMGRSYNHNGYARDYEKKTTIFRF